MISTLTRIAAYEENLLEAIKNYSEDFRGLPRGLCIEKYGMINKNPFGLIIISRGHLLHSDIERGGYNVILTITGRESTPSELFFKFKEKVPISFSMPNDSLEQVMQSINLSFLVFEKYPQQAINLLEKLANF